MRGGREKGEALIGLLCLLDFRHHLKHFTLLTISLVQVRLNSDLSEKKDMEEMRNCFHKVETVVLGGEKVFDYPKTYLEMQKT